METIVPTLSGLYPNLLGESWSGLDHAIQRLHHCGETVHAAGVFKVQHGNSKWARTLARVAQLPAAGDAVDVCLQITSGFEGETWQRTFAGQPLVTLQSRRFDGLLLERIGILEMRFRLQVTEGALNYRTVSAALCIGCLRVPLPLWLTPRITAWERPAVEPDQIDVSVEVAIPLLGQMIAYHGLLTRVEVHG